MAERLAHDQETVGSNLTRPLVAVFIDVVVDMESFPPPSHSLSPEEADVFLIDPSNQILLPLFRLSRYRF